MEHRIEEEGPFTLVGHALRTTMVDGRCLREIPPFWEALRADGRLAELESLAGRLGVCGVCHDASSDMSEFVYSIAIERPEAAGALPRGLGEIAIPASLWGKIVHRGPIAPGFQDTIQRAFCEWLPASGYRHAGTAELEIYLPGDAQGPDNVCEYWIPLARP